MRAVVQRVLRSSITVNGEVISSIGRGLLVLVGISKDDKFEDIEYIVRKILNVRFFEGDDGKKWSRSVMESKYEILCVSQFTLCHSLRGNKLDFHQAMKTDESKQFYQRFLTHLRQNYESDKVKDGRFGAYMEVELTNDGPVTVDIVSVREAKGAEGDQFEISV